MATNNKNLTGRAKANDKHLLADDDSGHLIILDRSADSATFEVLPSAQGFQYGEYVKDGMGYGDRFRDYNTYINSSRGHFGALATWRDGYCYDDDNNAWSLPMICGAGPGWRPSENQQNCKPKAGWFATGGIVQRYSYAGAYPAKLCKITKIKVRFQNITWGTFLWPMVPGVRSAATDFYEGRQPIIRYMVSGEQCTPRHISTRAQGEYGIKAAAQENFESIAGPGTWQGTSILLPWASLDMWHADTSYTTQSMMGEIYQRWSHFPTYNKYHWVELNSNVLTDATAARGELYLHAWMLFPFFKDTTYTWLLEEVRVFASALIERIEVTVAWDL